MYGNKFGYIKSYPMDGYDKKNLGDSIPLIIQESGVTQKLHTENSPRMVGRNTPLFKRERK